MQTSTYFEVRHSEAGSICANKKGHYSFKTQEEAQEVIDTLKANPREISPKMSDENVLYWQNQTYSIIKVTKTQIEEVISTDLAAQ